MEEEGTVIQIDGPNACGVIVNDKHLLVDEPRGVFIDFHTGFQQFFVIGAGQIEDHLFIGDVGYKQANVQPFFSGEANRIDHFFI